MSLRPAEEQLRVALEGALGVPFTEGNEVVPFVNGVRIFPPMLEAIAKARHRIELLTYIYWTGQVAIDFVEALVERARAGVEVRVLLDGIGALPMPRKLVRQMVDAGVQARWFRPVPGFRLDQMIHRTHRKLLVVDSEIAFTGGVGIAAEWEGDGDGPRHWRETHFACRGPCVRALRAAFYQNWMETEFDAMPMLTPDTPAATAGNMSVQVVMSSASYSFSAIAVLHEALADAARRHIRIVTPYFVPSDDTVGSLVAARGRGVEIDIMVPGPHVDSRVSDLAGSDAFDPLLKAGVRIWRYQPTLLHAKVITVDGILACVGSANFNQRSQSKDDEVALNVLSTRLCAQLDRQFADDQRNCERVSLWKWRRRGQLRRLAEVAAYFIRPHT
jgi:cardiolipin synthase